MAEEKNNYMLPLVAMVAIVAIVGVIMMFMNKGTVSYVTTATPEVQAATQIPQTANNQLTAEQQKMIDDAINNPSIESNTAGAAINTGNINFCAGLTYYMNKGVVALGSQMSYETFKAMVDYCLDKIAKKT